MSNQQPHIAASTATETATATTVDSGYEWDPIRGGWFPKFTEEMQIQYAMAYGGNTTTTTTTTTASTCNAAVHGEERRVDDVPDAKEMDRLAAKAAMTFAAEERDANVRIESQRKRQKIEEGEKEEGKEDVAMNAECVANTNTTKGSAISTDSNMKKKKKKELKWNNGAAKQNKSVYVSGLPADIDEVEFAEFMQRCGIIKVDISTIAGQPDKPRVKLYRDSDGNIKGDGIATYLKGESVDLAVQMLHESQIRPCVIVSVEPAKFELKGQFDETKVKRRTKLKTKKGKKPTHIQDKLLSWDDGGGEDEKRLRKTQSTVIIKNLFDPKDVDEDPDLFNDLTDDVRSECEKIGEVRKLQLFDRNPEGVCMVRFESPELATQCIALMNGRFFGGIALVAHVWDGVTKYLVEETDEQKALRLKRWNEFLKSGGETSEAAIAPNAPTP